MEFSEDNTLNNFADNQEKSTNQHSTENEVETTISEALKDLNDLPDGPSDSDSVINKNLDYISKLCDENSEIISKEIPNQEVINTVDKEKHIQTDSVSEVKTSANDKISEDLCKSLEIAINDVQKSPVDNIDLNELSNTFESDLPSEDTEEREDVHSQSSETKNDAISSNECPVDNLSTIDNTSVTDTDDKLPAEENTSQESNEATDLVSDDTESKIDENLPPNDEQKDENSIKEVTDFSENHLEEPEKNPLEENNELNSDVGNKRDETIEASIGDEAISIDNQTTSNTNVTRSVSSTSGCSDETSFLNENQKTDEKTTNNESDTESSPSHQSKNPLENIKDPINLNFVNSPNAESQDSNDEKEMVSICNNTESDDFSREDSQDDEEETTESDLVNEEQNHIENREFVQVSEKDDDKDDNNKDEILEDPIGGDNLDMIEGQDEELCIIPDPERITAHDEDIPCPIKPLLSDVTDITIRKNKCETAQNCYKCDQRLVCKYEFMENDIKKYICEDICLESLKSMENVNVILKWENEIRVKNLSDIEKSRGRVCYCCNKAINTENYLSWEIMEFCNDTCLSKTQSDIGSKCMSCAGAVRSNALGKYCVRFGNDIRQFCSSLCLEDYKKGLKVCSYCQQEVSNKTETFVSPVGGKGTLKDFCSQDCLNAYDIIANSKLPSVPENTKCGVCKLDKPITILFEYDGTTNYFCGDPCVTAYNFVNNIKSGKCAMCSRTFAQKVLDKYSIFYEGKIHNFCTNSCKNIYVIANRKIVPCSWCKVKKYNFDMIQKCSGNDQVWNTCSLSCLSLYQVSVDAIHLKKTCCDHCQKHSQAMYHITMSDATVRNFCSYYCVWEFQNQFKGTSSTPDEPVPTGNPKKNKRKGVDSGITLPVISSVQSLATTNGSFPATNTRTTRSKSSLTTPTPLTVQTETQTQVVKHHIVVKQKPLPEMRNVLTMCRPRVSNKGTNSVPTMEDASTQTIKREADKILIPVPVPIFVPLPLHMFTMPTPMPVPIPIPVPVPIFIPTTRNSANGIMKEIKKIQVKIPTNPYEAELLMMAEMVADDKKEEHTDSESDEASDVGGGGGFSPDPQDATTSFGDDMLQMALKMATELDEPAVDLEGALTANTITAAQQEHVDENAEVADTEQDINMMDRAGRGGRKRGIKTGNRGQTKRGRRSLSQIEMPVMPAAPPPEPVPIEKPDANMCLKYTFGVNAWKQWVTYKNAELEKSSRRVKLFKTEILQLTSDELNYSLCLFVKEVRKPNGAEYAPDTIYYLCLGIQQYLFENGRIDNIFCDPYYEMFTDCLDEVAKKFSVLYNDSHYIVTRVEEEHLWESKQLGAHSPHVLLSTLMFFNTKHFNLTTVEEHMQLSFSHIMKHWKRNPSQVGSSKAPGSRNVLLRFYPPQSAQLLENSAKKKKVYEQQENEENPLRCPVKLYEFYLSKCPESVKTRNDVFYLQPERSCVPDSPVWYSTMALPKEALEKMLHRVKIVKEINVALLTS